MSDFKDSDDSKDEGKQAKTFSWMPEGCEALADGEYDAIIMGTGLTECIISGLLSVNGKRVLHVDRNNYYGADTASLSLLNLFQKFRSDAPGTNLGHSRGKHQHYLIFDACCSYSLNLVLDWNVDLIPKFIMSCGKLTKILLHTKVTRYLEFKSIDGSYVFKDGKVQKVPGKFFLYFCFIESNVTLECCILLFVCSPSHLQPPPLRL